MRERELATKFDSECLAEKKTNKYKKRWENYPDSWRAKQRVARWLIAGNYRGSIDFVVGMHKFIKD